MEAVTLKRTPALTRRICRSPESIPMKTTFFKYCGEELERLESPFGCVKCIQSYPLPLHRDGTKRPKTELLHEFGTLNWRDGDADYCTTIAQAS